MRNILLSNYEQAFVVVDKAAENASGGVGIWEVPMAAQYAYNPIIYTRTHYLHKTAGYEPEGKKPNYIKIGGLRLLVFDYPLASSLHIGVTFDSGVKRSYVVGAGREQWSIIAPVADGDVVALDYVAFEQESFESICEDNHFIYICEGTAYQGEGFLTSESGDVLYRETSVEPLTLRVRDMSGKEYRMRVDSLGGVAKFDVAPIVRKWFDRNSISERALLVHYKTAEIQPDKVMSAVNGVAQPGEDSAVSLGLLTRAEVFHDYGLAGIEIAELIFDEETYSHKILFHDPSEAVLPLVAECMPRNPLYLRWINQMGGLDYWMFSRRQTVKEDVRSVSFVEQFVENPALVETNIAPYATDTDSTVTIGAEGVNDADFSVLKMLPFSRFVQRYDFVTGNWVRVMVSKASNAYNIDMLAHDLELELKVFNINTQY